MHKWNVTPKEAVQIQRRLASRICLSNDLDIERIKYVAGSDVAFDKASNQGFGAIVVFSFPEMTEIETATVSGRISFPYVPGLLTFREAPLLIRAFRRLKRRPDVLIHDGQGYAHPRRLGIASHLGIFLDLPTIGCAKSRLIGDFVQPGPTRGDTSILSDRGEIIGMVVRSRDRVAPLFISTGHRIGLLTAVDIVLRGCRNFRLPDPTRRAHQLAGKAKRAEI